jgi:MFS family permease
MRFLFKKVAFYSTKIFENVGLKGELPTYVTIILSIVQVFMTLICMFIIERVGRRTLLIYGCIGMCISAFTIAISRINASSSKEYLYYITVCAAILYLICYSISLGPISWILTTELFRYILKKEKKLSLIGTNDEKCWSIIPSFFKTNFH